MSRRPLIALFALIALLTAVAVAGAGTNQAGELARDRAADRPHSGLPDGFVPAALRAKQLGRYFVVVDGPSVSSRMQSHGRLAGRAQESAARSAHRTQRAAVKFAKSAGGKVVYRYDTLLNGFSANLTPEAAAQMAQRSDVKSVQPVAVVQQLNETSVPFIGATKVWQQFGAQGQGMVVADVDTGIDYTHKNFGGPGTVAAYEANDPSFIEPGTFPTKKVIGGYDLVGQDYDVLDDNPNNDIPRPDEDPLDEVDNDHGSHTSGTCCGDGVPGEIGPGVAPKAKLLAIKVWDEGDSTDDVLVAGYERAMDPNDDGNTNDAADVLTFSGGVDYGTLNSVEARAAQRVVNMGTVFVAAAGNAGNQPVGGEAYITGTPANARGVISVAASIDDFEAQTITINSPQITLPDQGIMVQQDWGTDLPAGGITANLFDGRAIDPTDDPGNETPADAQFCNPLPAGSLSGKVVMVFKGSTSSGDCGGSLKAFNAQQAGAQAVVLISLFGGAPSALASGGENITIPVVMISGNDGYAILNQLSPNANYNSGTVNATLNDATTKIDAYTDAMTDFTSEGPARLTNDLKPDITAPGFDIQSTDAGTGDQGVKFSGTSMATPHVAGVATLLRQLHPSWSPELIKSVIMNQGVQDLKDNLLGSPVSATVMGSGRVDAFESAKAVSVASPGSLAYGLDFASGPFTESQSFKVNNLGKRSHSYTVSGGDARYSDFATSPAHVGVGLTNSAFAGSQSFSLQPGQSRTVYVQLQLNPAAIEEAEQELGRYSFHPNVDGNITIEQSGSSGGGHKVAKGNPHGHDNHGHDNHGHDNHGHDDHHGHHPPPPPPPPAEGPDTLHVPWHVAPLAASNDSLSKSSLNLTGPNGQDTMELVSGAAAGVSQADLYLLGATDPQDSLGEEDIVAIGARSFTGADVSDGNAEGVPDGTDALGGIGWLDFLADPDPPSDPIEFGVQNAAVHNTTATHEIDVLVDTGADGVYAGDDEGIPADYLLVKQPAAGGEVCVFDLSQPNALDDCSATYFADYSNYNSNVTGIVVGAGDVGLTNADSKLAYQVTSCTGTFSGDVPGQFCDTAGDEGSDGVYSPKLDAAHPALDISPVACKGFFGGSSCSGGDAIQVTKGTGAGADSDPSILALFPQNTPTRNPTVVTTDTTP